MIDSSFEDQLVLFFGTPGGNRTLNNADADRGQGTGDMGWMDGSI